MSEVKRFKPVINNKPYTPYAYCEENSEGIYVRIDDYDALKAERDALAVECAQYKSLAEKFAERADDYKSGNFGYSVFDSSNEFKQHIKTAATDAYLNSVRAGVIKQLHSEQKEWALVTWQYDSFDALKRAAVRHGDSELSGVIFMLDRIEGFATQLRAGEPS